MAVAIPPSSVARDISGIHHEARPLEGQHRPAIPADPSLIVQTHGNGTCV